MDDHRILQLRTPEDMLIILKDKGRTLDQFHKGDTVMVWNKMQKAYSYQLAEEPGQGLDPRLKTWADPGLMLSQGVFEGKYLNDCLLEFPAEWFLHAIALDKLRPGAPDVSVNGFQVDSRLPLPDWRRRGWVPGASRPASRSILSDAAKNPDERGWFQWYCRYWMGRRIPELDEVQIKRWTAFSRHAGQIRANCKPGDLTCRPRQRQALLQWSWNPFL